MHATTVAKIIFYVAPLVFADKKANLQWAICEDNPQDTLVKLGLAAATPPYKENPITYYDEKPPVHIHSGLMFRTKTNKGQRLSDVKVRFDQETADVPDFVQCGWGRYGSNPPTYTCEKRSPLDSEPGHVWTEDQRQFVQRCETVDWPALEPYGPFTNPKWKLHVAGYKAKFDDVVADGMHLMEVAVHVPLSEADEATKSITFYLTDRGVVLCDPQEGKTMRLFRAKGYIDGEEGEL